MRKKGIVCPSCGTPAREPLRTWTLTSPLPDKQGRITVTIMGAFLCDSCGRSWNAVVQKLKVGGEEERGEKKAASEPYTITIDLDEL